MMHAPSCPRPSSTYLAQTKSRGAPESGSRGASTSDGADDDATRAAIDELLSDPARRNVVHSYSLHAATEVEGGLKLHLVLKFRYDEALIEEYFGATKPSKAVEKRYGDAHRLFPYCIFNSIEETNISWTYQNKDGKVYERIELFVTVTSVTYSRYHPHILKLLCLKVGSDGTAKTGAINLRPELDEAGRPNVDFGVFKKETSEYRIADNGVETGDVVRWTSAQDLTAVHYTRHDTARQYRSVGWWCAT